MPTNELDTLKERADFMGITYHPSIGVDKLRQKIEAQLTPDKTKDILMRSESKPQRSARLRKEANQLTRIRLTCMNPNKKGWPGEIISVSNSSIGTIKKYIPYNAEDGWHVPKVILNVLEDRKYQSFYTANVDGKKIKRSKLVKEFAIEYLPNLTMDELKALAAKQALNNSTAA